LSTVCNRDIKIGAQTGPASLNSDQPAAVMEALGHSEHLVEAGSAFFARAFSEALALTADIELHNLPAALVHTAACREYLQKALTEYGRAGAYDEKTNLAQYHFESLTSQLSKIGGAGALLRLAQREGFLSCGDEELEKLAETFESGAGPASLMDRFRASVSSAVTLTQDPPTVDETPDKGTYTRWQEFAWRLIALFSASLQVGQALAILNTFTARVVDLVEAKA
jgi:hypothetical protein